MLGWGACRVYLIAPLPASGLGAIPCRPVLSGRQATALLLPCGPRFQIRQLGALGGYVPPGPIRAHAPRPSLRTFPFKQSPLCVSLFLHANLGLACRVTQRLASGLVVPTNIMSYAGGSLIETRIGYSTNQDKAARLVHDANRSICYWHGHIRSIPGPALLRQ